MNCDRTRPLHVHAALTRTQRSVALDLLSALAPAAIADLRGISLSTVRNHIAAIHRKVGVHSRAEAILWCIAHESCCLVMPWDV